MEDVSQSDDDLVWARIDLADLAAVVDDYEPWKFDPWYDRVNWDRVNLVADDLLQEVCIACLAPGLFEHSTRAGAQLERADREGLWSLVHAPIDVTPLQIYNGGHRLRAMRAQGLRWVPAQVPRIDVDSSQIYPR